MTFGIVFGAPRGGGYNPSSTARAPLVLSYFPATTIAVTAQSAPYLYRIDLLPSQSITTGAISISYSNLPAGLSHNWPADNLCTYPTYCNVLDHVANPVPPQPQDWFDTSWTTGATYSFVQRAGP